ncbi:enolase-phosphatase E1 isoform X2 [Penaeus vannamei]|uniref:enolase-phosphatase E1 isoform X2 n=1 Tax=Penaeus vannamei TaxID=6689 RepID=UPI00387F3EED
MDQQRYKRRGLQFTSATDSRALRAIQHRESQRSRRENAITQRRQIGSLEDSVDEGRPQRNMSFSILEEMPKKKSLEELGRERYQQLLKWKEEKRKRLEKERKVRKPSFKTGIFQPDTPKYLVSMDDGELSQTLNKTPGRPTPFKFLVRSSKKSGETPGTSAQKPLRFCTGVTPGVSTYRRLPTFGMGTTPDQSLQRAGRQNSEVGSAKPAHRTRAALKASRKERNEIAARKGPLRGRPSKLRSKQTEAEELGVKPLPRTPQALQRPRFSKAITHVADTRDAQEPSSFAPSDFTFEFNVQRALSLIRSCTENDASEDHNEPSPPKRRRSRRSSQYSKKEEDVQNPQQEEITKGSPQSLPHVECVSQQESDDSSTGTYVVGDQCIADSETLQQSGCESADGDVEADLQEELEASVAEEEEEAQEEQKAEEPMSEEETQDQIPPGDDVDSSRNTVEAEEPQVKEALTLEAEENVEGECKTMEEEDCALEDNEPLSLHLSSEKTTHTRRKSKAKTPARRSTRRSIACCGEGITPTLSRLRPRTPCSRSTRRSLSAHCDSPVERVYTPLRQASSRRRSTRRSVGSALKLKNISEAPITDIPKFSLPCESNAEGEDREILEEEGVMEPLENLTEVCGEDDAMAESTDATATKVTAAEDKPEFATPNQVAFKKSQKTPSSEKASELATPIQVATGMSQTTPSEKATDSLIDATPRSHGRRSKVSWMVEGSPWINTARRSSQKKRRSGVPPDILSLFHDIPTDGSPLPAHLTPEGMRTKDLGASPVTAVYNSPMGAGNASVLEDQTCTNLLALLEPTVTTEHVDSPDIDVWGEDSPAVATAPANDVHCTPVTSKQTSILGSANQNMLLINAASPKLQYPAEETKREAQEEKCFSPLPQAAESKEVAAHGILSETNTLSKGSSGRNKSRRSVMFAVQEDQENLGSPHFRFPGTPVRASSRVSMGLFSKVDTNTDTFPTQGEDLMGFDSPQSEKKTAPTRRKSARISLLPGMEPLKSPAPLDADHAPPVVQDLISWDTPLERNTRRRSRRSAVSSLATPRRQSRRVSKAPML